MTVYHDGEAVAVVSVQALRRWSQGPQGRDRDRPGGEMIVDEEVCRRVLLTRSRIVFLLEDSATMIRSVLSMKAGVSQSIILRGFRLQCHSWSRSGQALSTA